MYKIWKHFEKGQVIACTNCMWWTARIGPVVFSIYKIHGSTTYKLYGSATNKLKLFYKKYIRQRVSLIMSISGYFHPWHQECLYLLHQHPKTNCLGTLIIHPFRIFMSKIIWILPCFHIHSHLKINVFHSVLWIW